MTEFGCSYYICMVAADSSSSSFFGFGEFASSLALLIVLFTISDTRYKFRIAVAPSNLYLWSAGLMFALGTLILLADLWTSQAWYVPASLMSRGSLDAVFAGLYLATIFVWVWYAFVRPPVFDNVNCDRYASNLYRLLLRGREDDLAEISDEVARSAQALVVPVSRLKNKDEPSKFQSYATDVILMLGDRRFCRMVVRHSPGTVVAFVDAIEKSKAFRIPIEQFLLNVVAEGFKNVDSFVYSEEEGWDTGYFGYTKPISTSIFGNYQLASELNRSPLDVSYRDSDSWAEKEWAAYARVCLISIESYLTDYRGTGSQHVINRAVRKFEGALMSSYYLKSVQEVSAKFPTMRILLPAS